MARAALGALGLKPALPALIQGLKHKKNKSRKFWTEPRSCMVLGLKPMGKPSTRDKNQKLRTEPRSCMVHGLKPMGKPTTRKEKLHYVKFGFIWGKLSTRHWVRSQIAGIRESALRSAAPRESMWRRAIRHLRNDLSSLPAVNSSDGILILNTIFNCYLC